MLSVPKTNVQHTILVPCEGITLRTILGPLECHYRAVVGDYRSLSLYIDFIFSQVISRLDIPELLVLEGSLFAWFCLFKESFIVVCCV